MVDFDVARAALNQPALIGGIDDEGDPSIQLYHLLCSLLAFCAAHNLDFNATLRDARSAIATP